MKQDVKLYIGDKLVEFTKKPEIIFNYKTTDLTHPTAIKNTFTKTILLDDTAVNNEVFGNIWNVEKYIFSTSSVGSGFNANKKVPFKLYVNSELYEKGYVKLDSIDNISHSKDLRMYIKACSIIDEYPKYWEDIYKKNKIPLFQLR